MLSFVNYALLFCTCCDVNTLCYDRVVLSCDSNDEAGVEFVGGGIGGFVLVVALLLNEGDVCTLGNVLFE